MSFITLCYNSSADQSANTTALSSLPTRRSSRAKTGRKARLYDEHLDVALDLPASSGALAPVFSSPPLAGVDVAQPTSSPDPSSASTSASNLTPTSSLDSISPIPKPTWYVPQGPKIASKAERTADLEAIFGLSSVLSLSSSHSSRIKKSRKGKKTISEKGGKGAHPASHIISSLLSKLKNEQSLLKEIVDNQIETIGETYHLVASVEEKEKVKAAEAARTLLGYRTNEQSERVIEVKGLIIEEKFWTKLEDIRNGSRCENEKKVFGRA